MQKFIMVGLALLSCLSIHAQKIVYKDAKQPVETRVKDLLNRMTLREKILQLNQFTIGENDNPNNVGAEVKNLPPGIGSLIFLSTDPELRNRIQHKAMDESRLGIPILFGFDVIHGLRTVYPISLAQACSFNPELVTQACRMAARESVLSGIDWTFSPMIDVARDPRWGRISECYGEDPYLNGVFGVASVKGYQGDNLSDPYSIAACLKHYVGYGASEGGRDYRYTEISAQTLWDTYLPPYEVCVKAGAATLMSAFNDISGVPATSNRYALTEILKNKWGHDGFVVSDWNAIEQLIYQGVARDGKEAAYQAFRAGVEMDMRDNLYNEHLEQLVAEKKIPSAQIDDAVARVLRLKFRLGLFDTPYVPVRSEKERYLQKEDVALAARLAEESMVLLKNDKQVLPLSSAIRKLAVIGPMAKDNDNLLGAWAFKGRAEDVETIYKGIEHELGGRIQLSYAHGCALEGEDESGFAAALDCAKASDAIVLCLGEDRHWSGENASRSTISLPAIQEKLLLHLEQANKPLVLILSSGRPLELLRIEPQVDAIIEMWQPGVAGGTPLAGILSGRVNPSGKLPVTFPLSTGQIPIYYNMRQSARPFDAMGNYQDISTEPLYPFGHGLSYTTFVYSGIRLSAQKISKSQKLAAEVTVTNTGKVKGKETVLWYITDPFCSISRPVKELKFFEKQELKAGEARVYRFEIDPMRDLSYIDASGNRFLETGEFVLRVGEKELTFELTEDVPQDITSGWNSNKAAGLAEPLFVYNNWSAYDELSDNIPLDEALALKELEHVVRLKKQGVRVDYYLMDAFWFDINKGYRQWRTDRWPEGPRRWLEACRKEGIKPGLWFSTNLLRIGGPGTTLKPIPEWEGSVSEDESTLCLFRGGYLAHLMETLQMYADMGVKLFKFDFAYFDAATPEVRCTLLPTEIEEQNKNAFILAMKEFRYRNPEVLVIGYNGFGGDMENTITPFRKTVDGRWLEIFDTMYCGDPRLSDVPMMNFWRSQDVYSDHMTFQYLFNGLPIQRIDNCAFMIGTTGTCYNRALNAWRGMMILTMARGGWLNVCHGNIDLLSDEDARWMGKVQQLYMSVQRYGSISAFGGIPGQALPYGYAGFTDGGQLYTVVNASQSKERIVLPGASGEGRILFRDNGFVPILKGNSIELGPEQMAVIGFGKFGAQAYELGIEKDIVIPESIRQVEVDIRKKDPHTLQARCIPLPGKTVRILFQQQDEHGQAFRSWGGAPPTGRKMDTFFTIEARQGKRILPLKKSHDKVIWCGLSWAVAEVAAGDIKAGQPLDISCTAAEGDSRYGSLEIYEVSYP